MRTLFFVVSLWLTTSPLWGKIVFYSKRDGNPEIYTMDSDGSSQTRLTFNEAGDGWPTWSPNGQQILFESERDGNWEVYVMDADGKNQRNLTHHPAFDSNPHWHPDGQRIAFSSDREPVGIYTMDNTGGNLRLVAQARFTAELRWSPDGKRIAFEGVFGEGTREIYVADADGANQWQVSETVPRSSMRLGDWSPDGKKILYTVIVAPRAHGGAWESFMVIAKLHPWLREVTEFEQVELPPNSLVDVEGEGWGPYENSLLISGQLVNNGIWNIFRFRFSDNQVIQLTDDDNFAAHEWDPRLPVAPKRVRPIRWGQLKSSQLPLNHSDFLYSFGVIFADVLE